MENEEGERRPKRASKAMRAAQRAFEPSLLEERFMTDRDERIRSTDIPERFQVSGCVEPETISSTKVIMWADRGFGKRGFVMDQGKRIRPQRSQTGSRYKSVQI
jgi:hypothetical protein